MTNDTPNIDIAEKFAQSLDILRNEIRQAYISFRILKGLEQSEIEYIDEMNDAYVFFINTIFSHMNTATLCLIKVLDHRNDINIKKLVNIADQNRTIFKSDLDDTILQDHHSWYENNQDIIKNLLTLRDKYLAHLDKVLIKKNINELFEENPVTYGEYEKAITKVDEIVLYYRNKLDGTNIAKVVRQDEDDYKIILEALRIKRKK